MSIILQNTKRDFLILCFISVRADKTDVTAIDEKIPFFETLFSTPPL
ncbi:MAG: hypothetical protein LBT89_01895 [Planctomycetaceae bacterium]|nr:hypothetical protein [Planctomycetaceae bacterium]